MRIRTIDCRVMQQQARACPDTLQSLLEKELRGKRLLLWDTTQTLHPITDDHGVQLISWKRQLPHTFQVRLKPSESGLALAPALPPTATESAAAVSEIEPLYITSDGTVTSIPAGDEITIIISSSLARKITDDAAIPTNLQPLLQLPTLLETYSLTFTSLRLEMTPEPVLITRDTAEQQILIPVARLTTALAALDVLERELELPPDTPVAEIDLRYDHPVVRATPSGSLSPGQ